VALAIGSKESAVLVPVAAAAVVLAFGLGLRRALAAFAATGISAAVLLAIRLAVLRVSPLTNSLAELDSTRRLAAILKALSTYAVSLLTARPIVRLPQLPRDAFDAGVVAGAALSVALLTVLVTTRLRSPAALGVVVLGTSLAPALAIWHLRIPMWKEEIPVAERWLYLPAAGLAILAASVLRRLPRQTCILAGAGLAAALAFGTWQLNPVYASADTYNDWAADAFLSSPPRNPREQYLAHFFRARRLRDEGRNEEALGELFAADRISPWLPDHLWQMAEVQITLGRPREAVKLIERFLSPAYRQNPAGIAQRIDMGNDTLQRLSSASGWRFLARARAAAGDAAGARDALSASGALPATLPGDAPRAPTGRPDGLPARRPSSGP
jgi:tetratricopeptide (TPR) repeat protein